MPSAKPVQEESPIPEPEIEAPPASFTLTQDEMNNLIATKVSEGIAAALPAVLAEIAKSQVSGPVFGGGMGPSEQVVMSNVPTRAAAPTYLKHYRKDDAINGKHQLIDVSKLENGKLGYPDDRGNIAGVMKGQYIQFVNGDFYATEQIEVDFVEWLQKTSPMSRIYEVQGRGIIPCEVVNCGMTFANEGDLNNHKQATHGLVM